MFLCNDNVELFNLDFPACMLHTAETQFGDLSGMNVADLGCGSGILSVGSGLLDADMCIGIDIDLGDCAVFIQLCY